MADTSYGGWQAYLIIERQAGSQCPIGSTIEDAGTGDPTLMNGIVYVSTAYAAPYASFNDFLNGAGGDPGATAWVFDVDTGEGRYYDGTQAGDVTHFWPAEKRAVGMIYNTKPVIEATVQEIKQIGANRAGALKNLGFSNTLDFEKAWIDMPKLLNVDYDEYTNNLAAFRGEALVVLGEWVKTIRHEYHLVIIYAKEHNNDTGRIASSWIAPCAKFEKVALDIDRLSLINASLSGKATYIRPLPEDDNIATYTYDFS